MHQVCGALQLPLSELCVKPSSRDVVPASCNGGNTMTLCPCVTRGITGAYRLDFCSDVVPFDSASEVFIGQEQLPQHLQATPLGPLQATPHQLLLSFQSCMCLLICATKAASLNSVCSKGSHQRMRITPGCSSIGRCGDTMAQCVQADCKYTSRQQVAVLTTSG